MNSSAPPQAFRLRRQTEGEDEVYDLMVGEHRVGSSAGSDLRLTATGISRQHALLLVRSGHLVVEDRGSTNGTFVNGTRVDRAEVPPGAELRFGAARFRLETLEADDAELAIEIDAARSRESDAPPSGLSFPETTRFGAEDGEVPGAWLALIERYLKALATRGDLADALAIVGEALGLEGVCAVEWSSGEEPVVLATWAAIHGIPARREIHALRRSRRASDAETITTGLFESRPPLCLAVLGSGESEELGLFLWGDFSHRESCPSLLRTLVTLADRWRAHPVSTDHHQDAFTSYPELVFPEGYCVGSSEAMRSLYRQMRVLVKGDLAVLVQGETGVGKEHVAAILHASSTRARGPFVAINCAAIPAELLEAEMFGIGRGVATGVEKRPGKFMEAEGGTLFLDEVGELLPAVQAKLLRALQEKEIHPVGGKAVKIDLRIVAATNAELAERIESGLFRGDLYYRLAGYTLEVAPLRRRSTDVPALVEHFLRREAQKSGIRVRGVTVRALRILRDYAWPGNVRQLEHEVRRLVYQSSDGQVIDSGALSPALRATGGDSEPSQAERTDGLALAARVHKFEAAAIRDALARVGGHQGRAAELLGLSRNGLVKKMSRLGLTKEEKGGPLESRSGKPAKERPDIHRFGAEE